MLTLRLSVLRYYVACASLLLTTAYSSIKLSCDNIQTTHRQYRIRDIASLYHLRVRLIVDETWPSEMQAERGASAVAYQVKAEFAVATFHTVVSFSLRDVCFSHYYLKMIDERLHIIVDLRFRRKIEYRNIGVIRSVGQLFEGLADDAQALPHFFLPDEKTIVCVAVL